MSNIYAPINKCFFDEADLHFRAVVAGKSGLDHQRFSQDHDDWYYKMYFQLLSPISRPPAQCRFYLDLKDTRSARKITHLHNVLCNDTHDYGRKIAERIQSVRSHEVEQSQLADLLIGVVSYANRTGGRSPAKAALVKQMERCSGQSLLRSTPLSHEKFNLFHWTPRRGRV